MNLLAIMSRVALCAAATLAGNEYPAPVERQVAFRGEGGVTLAGTLALPPDNRGAAAPALVLIAGSGPTDRDGNQPPFLMTGLLKQIARILAEQGVASLRFDKRGMYANAAHLPKLEAEYGDFFTWENFAGDAQAAYTFLREQPHIDRSRVGILGHSEGGLLALVTSERLTGKGGAPAALVLLSTPGRTIDAVITDQVAAALTRQGAGPRESVGFLDANAAIIKAIRQTGKVPPDVPPGLMALYPSYLGRFLNSELAVDPPALAHRFSGPVLVLAGASDVQVSPRKDAGALDAALSERKADDHAFFVVPRASHNLKNVKDENDPGFAGVVSSEAAARLSEWVAAKLKPPAAGTTAPETSSSRTRTRPAR